MEGKRISLREASELTGYHSDYISSLIRNGQIRGEKEGRNWFTTKREVERYLSTRKYLPLGVIIRKRTLFAFVAVIFFIAGTVFLLMHQKSTSSISTTQVSRDENEPIIANE